jgi:DNA-binding protein YbaB
MFDQMKKLMEMKKQADQIKRELETIHLETEHVTGIHITVDGAQKIKKISIADDFLSVDNKERFEAQLLKSINYALSQSQAKAAEKMKSSMNFNLPGF